MTQRQIIVLWRRAGAEPLRVGLLVYEAGRDYWRYVPDPCSPSSAARHRIPLRFRLAESDPNVQRLKRRLTDAIFREPAP